MSDSTIKASAPGKLILLGEYAVLEEAPCLVAATNRSCFVKISPLQGETFRLEASNPNIPDIQFTLNGKGDICFQIPLSSANQKRLRFVLSTLRHVIQQNNGKLPAAGIQINSESFYHDQTGHKLGLGASAAITVSLLSALMKFIGKPLEGNELYREAYEIHRNAQGKLGSGTDIAASANGGVIQYRMQMTGSKVDGLIERVEWPRDLQVIPIWTGSSASTQNMVRQIQTYRDENPSSYNAVMNPMKQLSEEGCKAFCMGDVEGFLEIIAKFVRQEQKLGEVSKTDILTKAHKEIAAIVKDAGGSYKPSGAGGGDIGVAFCGDMDTRISIINAIKKSNFDILDLSLQIGEMEMAENNEMD